MMDTHERGLLLHAQRQRAAAALREERNLRSSGGGLRKTITPLCIINLKSWTSHSKNICGLGRNDLSASAA